MNKDAAAVRSMFASIARRYDLLNHLLSLNQDKRWRKNAVESSASGNEKRVLDVCSGTADLAIAYAQYIGSAGLVVGTDFTPEMLRLGKNKISPSNESKLALLAADTLHLPFADNIFDIVSVAFGIRNVSDLGAGVREMTRVARDGGKVVILEFSLPESRAIRGAYLFYFTKLLPMIGRAISRAGNDAYSYLPASVLKFPAREEIAGVLQGCGLVNIHAKSFSFGIVTLYIGEKG
jgi:demethylmenaquinone methyltransferase/2-methoxy-6-polyprenyl-1,4-benzoquinol methylase